MKLTPAQIKAVESKIATLETFQGDYATEMLALYRKLLEMGA